jgi:hypothetical protein
LTDVENPGSATVARSIQTSLFEPSLAMYNGEIYVAWTGTDNIGSLSVGHIDVSRVETGGDPVDTVNVLNETSIAAPALLEMPASQFNPEDRLAIFWTGSDGAHYINGAVVYPLGHQRPDAAD